MLGSMMVVLLGCGSAEPVADAANVAPETPAPATAAPAPAGPLRLASGKTPTFTVCDQVGAALGRPHLNGPIYEADLSGGTLVTYIRDDKGNDHHLERFSVDLADGCTVTEDTAFTKITSPKIISGFAVFDEVIAVANRAESGLYGHDGVRKEVTCEGLKDVSRLERVQGTTDQAIIKGSRATVEQWTVTEAGCRTRILWDVPKGEQVSYYFAATPDAGLAGLYLMPDSHKAIRRFDKTGAQVWSVGTEDDLAKSVQDVAMVGEHTVVADGKAKALVVLDAAGAEVGRAPWQEALAGLGKYPRPKHVLAADGDTVLLLVEHSDGDDRAVSAVRVDL